ncbi:hypothetical protein [Metabacillus halosaccharovorans]|nr:hypothetical protein [Metabacillus halosaccharovorans]
MERTSSHVNAFNSKTAKINHYHAILVVVFIFSNRKHPNTLAGYLA